MTATITPSPSAPGASATGGPDDVLAVALDDDLLAREALLAGIRLGRRHSVELNDAAIVTRKRNGSARLIQTRSLTPERAAWMWAWWGSLIGLIVFGIAAWLIGAAIGAAVGWLWTRRHDTGVPDPWMRALVERLDPGEAAVVFEMTHVFPTHLIRELRRFDGRLLFNSLPGVDSHALEAALDAPI